MPYRILCSLGLTFFLLNMPTVGSAAIYEWTSDTAGGKRYQSTRLCADGANVVAAPYVNLSNLNLSKAFLPNADLTGAILNQINLKNAWMPYANLTSSTLSNANLDSAYFGDSNMAGTKLNDANLTGALFTNANLSNSTLTNSNLNYVYFFDANLIGTDFTGATIKGANFTFSNLTSDQLYSTASYKAHDISDIWLIHKNLTDWDFSDQDLTSTFFWHADLTNAKLTNTTMYCASFFYSNLSGADLTNASLNFASFNKTNISFEQICTTASYKAHDLSNIDLGQNNMTGWNFTGQNLSGANFSYSNLINADLSNCNLINADLNFANLHNAVLTNTNLTGNSFSNADLRGALGFNSLTGGTTENTYNTILPDGTMRQLNLGQYSYWYTIHNFKCLDGQHPIPIHITQEMLLENGSVLEVILNDKPWNSTISFEAGISVMINGYLSLKIDDDTDPQSLVGMSFHLFDWTGVNPQGQFQISSDDVWNNTNIYTIWDTSRFNTEGIVMLLAVPEPYTLLHLGCILAFLGLVIARRRVYFNQQGMSTRTKRFDIA